MRKQNRDRGQRAAQLLQCGGVELSSCHSLLTPLTSSLEVTLRGNRISTAINGTPVADFDASELKPGAKEVTGEGDPARGPRPESGYIGLQNHDKNSTVFFKEVSIRPLK